MLLLSLLLLTPEQTALDKPIDFRCAPTRVVNILPALSKATGTQLVVTGPPKDDVLVISIHGKPVSVVMAKIAEATSSEWKKQPTGYVLTSSKEIAAREIRQERDDAIAYWKRHLDALAKKNAARAEFKHGDSAQIIKDMKQISAFPAEGSAEDSRFRNRRVSEIYNQLPYGAVAERIAATLGPEWFANLHMGLNTFSNFPTVPEGTLPATSIQLLKKMEKDEEEFSRELRSATLGPEINAKSPFWGIIPNLAKFQGTPRCLVEASAAPGYCELKVIVRDGEGHYLGSSSFNFGLSPYDTPPPPSSSPHGDAVISFSPIVSNYFIAASEARTKPMPGPILDAVLRPDLVDMMALGTGDGFLSYADVQKRDVVVRLPDWNPYRLSQGFIKGEKTVTLDAFLNAYKDDAKMQWNEDAEWLVAKPARAQGTRAERLDRVVFARLLQAAKRQGYLSLNDVADYLWHQPASVEAVGYLYGSMYMLNKAPIDMASAWCEIRLFGSLTDEQKAAFWQRGVSYSSMTREQKAWMNYAVFAQPERYPTFSPPAKPPQSMDNISPELLPNGIPETAFFKGNVTSTAMVVGKLTGPTARYFPVSGFMTLSGKDFANYQYRRENPAKAFGPIPEFEGFMPAIQRSGDLTIYLAEGVSWGMPFKFDELEEANGMVKFEALPDEIKNEYAAELERLRRGG